MALEEAEPKSYLGRRAEAVYDALRRCLHLPGDVAECGVAAGATARRLAQIAGEAGTGKRVHLFDTFQGLPDVFVPADHDGATGDERWPGNYAHGAADVLAALGDQAASCVLHQGTFAETFPSFDTPLCFLHADADLFQSTADVIALAGRVLVPGGVVVFDDYGNPDFPGVRAAVDAHLDLDEFALTTSADGWQAFARRRGPAAAAAPAAEPTRAQP